MTVPDTTAIIAAARAILNDVRAMQSADHEFYFGPFDADSDYTDDAGTALISWPNLGITADALAAALGEPEYIPEWDRSNSSD